jgi:predicted MFS family arabinose efflux permease
MVRSSIALYRNAYAGLAPATWWLGLVMLVNRAGTMVIPFMAVYLRDAKHFTITQAGWEIAFFGVGAILGNFAGGRLSDKHGFYPIQFWSLFLNGILFIVLGEMQTFVQIAACMFVIGTVGESFRPANAAAIAYYSAPENRTRSYSLNRLAVNLGFSIGPAVGGLLAWHYLFIADGVTCMVAALLMRIALPEVKTGRKAITSNAVQPATGSVWRDGIYLRFMFFAFLAAVCFMQMFSMLPVFYKEQLHFSKAMVGLLLALNGFIIAIVEMVLVYSLEGKRSLIQYISFGAFFMGLSYAMLNLPLQGIAIALIAMGVITLGEMLMFPFVNSFWISRSAEHNRGQYASVYSMSFAAAQIIAPTFGSQVVRYFGYHVLWFVVFGICTIAALGFYTFKKYYQ